MIPLYGFLQGDTLGLLILTYGTETVAELTEKLVASGKVRVPVKPGAQLLFNGAILDPQLVLSQTDIKPLDRFDVVWSN